MSEITVHIRYFALLREQRGLSTESVPTVSASAASLYAELAARHRFSFDRSRLRVAINGDFSDWDQPLSDGDEVVFIPPVAGG